MMAGASAFFQPQKLYVFFPLSDTSFVQLPPLHQHPYINFLASLYHSHCKFSVFNIRYYSTVFSSTPIFSILHLTTSPPLRYSGYHISVKALVETKRHPDINIHSHSTANHIYTRMVSIFHMILSLALSTTVLLKLSVLLIRHRLAPFI